MNEWASENQTSNEMNTICKFNERMYICVCAQKRRQNHINRKYHEIITYRGIGAAKYSIIFKIVSLTLLNESVEQKRCECIFQRQFDWRAVFGRHVNLNRKLQVTIRNNGCAKTKRYKTEKTENKKKEKEKFYWNCVTNHSLEHIEQ